MRRVRPAARVGAAKGVAVAALALVAGVLLLAGPGGGRAAPQRPARAAPFDGILAGAPLQRARCEEWRAAPAAQRRGAVRAIAATIGGPSTTGGVGTTLPGADATALFDRVCATPATSGFALYLIYARAAAFSRVGRPAT